MARHEVVKIGPRGGKITKDEGGKKEYEAPIDTFPAHARKKAQARIDADHQNAKAATQAAEEASIAAKDKQGHLDAAGKHIDAMEAHGMARFQHEHWTHDEKAIADRKRSAAYHLDRARDHYREAGEPLSKPRA